MIAKKRKKSTQKKRTMSRPIVDFKHTPPVHLSTTEDKEVVIMVHPNCPGACEVTLSINYMECSFPNGEQQISQIVQSVGLDDVLECKFLLRMQTTTPGNHFTLLFAFAVNAEGEKSYRKPIELEIAG